MKRPWLLPLTPLYAAANALRSAALSLGLERTRELSRPVISVGSIAAGGAGKTPFTIALAQLLTSAGVTADVLSRGYGRVNRQTSALQVDADGSAGDFGDEPILIARETGLPVFVAARRFDAGRLAEKLNPQAAVHLLDDGFQHRQLARQLDIALVSSADLDDVLLPAGDRREGRNALARASVLAVASDDKPAADRQLALARMQPIWRFRRRMTLPAITGSAVAFCGIARPGQFFSGLKSEGIGVAATQVFPDHHRFTASDLARLNGMVEQSGAVNLITTAKDYVRLGSLATQLGFPLHAANLQIQFENPKEILAAVEAMLRRVSPRQAVE